MPSGAKKRKAAKRKKEEQEKGKEAGSISHPPVSPTNDPLPPSPPQGNGHEDRMPHEDGLQSESGEFETPPQTPFATPSSEANHPLAEEAGEEAPGSQRVAVNSAVESPEDGDGEEADGPADRPDELANGDAAALEVEAVAAASDEVARGAEGTEMEKPAEESVVAVERSVLPSEEAKQEQVAPPPVRDEIKGAPSCEREVKVVPLPDEEDEVENRASYEWEAKVVPRPDENEVKERSSHEGEGRGAALPDEDEVGEEPSQEREVKVAPLLDEDVTGEAGQGTGRAETVLSAEVALCTPVVAHRARWWNCCGLLDVLKQKMKM